MSKDAMIETIDNDIEIIEEFLNIDESLIALEQNKELIRMEMNIIEFPIFSRSNLLKINQVKKYYFATDKSSYLEVLPAVGSAIPGEFEERVFIALLKIFKKSGFKNTFYCKASDILENMNISNIKSRKALYTKVRQAISRLTTTTFRFKNLFYSNEIKDVMEDLIETNILTYRVVTFKDANRDEKDFFSDKRIKEVYKISLSKHFYENIIRKGYLVFDADELLNIKDSITRSIYTMITKWRNNQLYLKRPAFYIARRIPLAWNKHSIKKTIPRIEKSLKELQEFNFISGYNLDKKDKLEKSEFEIFFSEEHNKLKREIFFNEKNNFDQVIHLVEERQNEFGELIENKNTVESITVNKILDIFGERGKKLKTLPGVIKEALKKHEFDYVAYSAEYTMINCKVSYIKYFKETLENNWADEYIAKKEAKAEKKAKLIEAVIEEAEIIEEIKEEEAITVTWEEFEKLEGHVKAEIEAAAYEEYLMEIGSNDNKIVKGIFEKSKKSHILKIFSKYEIPEIKPIKEVKTKKKKEEVSEKLKVENIQAVEKETGKKSEENVVLSDSFATVSRFMLKVLTFIKTENFDIDSESFMTLFNHFKEYDDEFVTITYDEATKLGKIIKK